MHILPVENPRQIRAFIQFPYQHYRDDPVWVPPLRGEQRKQFSWQHNPMLEHCDWQLFLLADQGKIIGRVAAFIDLLANDFWQDRIGLFGYFECIQDETAGQILLQTARTWLENKGMRTMRGPWSFVSQEWGSVVEGFSPSPVVMAPYNPSYYNEFYEAFGLQKVQDMLCWSVSVPDGYRITERILKLTDRVADRYGVRIRTLDMRRYKAEVQTIIELSNLSIIDNWGYSPVTEAEAQTMAADLKQVIQSKGVIFADDANGKTIGFAIAIPDLNVLLQGLDGRLFPFGFLKLLWGLPRLKCYRLFGLGVLPEYHGKGIDSLLYRALYESLYTPETEVEINYVLEDNWAMINAIKKLNATPLRRYRVYEREL